MDFIVKQVISSKAESFKKDVFGGDEEKEDEAAVKGERKKAVQEERARQAADEAKRKEKQEARR